MYIEHVLYVFVASHVPTRFSLPPCPQVTLRCALSPPPLLFLIHLSQTPHTYCSLSSYYLQVTLRCALSRRQSQLYAALRKDLTLQDLVAMNTRMAAAAAAAGGAAPAAGAAVSSSAASARLMGLIMQMRKVRLHLWAGG